MVTNLRSKKYFEKYNKFSTLALSTKKRRSIFIGRAKNDMNKIFEEEKRNWELQHNNVDLRII